MLNVQAASWTSGAAETQTVLQSKLCLSMDVQTAQIDSITKGSLCLLITESSVFFQANTMPSLGTY